MQVTESPLIPQAMATGEMDDPQPLPEPSTASSASGADVYPEADGSVFLHLEGRVELGVRV